MMNERIRELAEYAGMKLPFGGFPNYDEFDFEKFAELIVKECVSKIGDVYKDALDYDMEDWDRGFLGGLSCAMDTVQKHFGVEE
jgi:hypothetical protein